MKARKLMRTLQSEVPFLKKAKQSCYYHGRKLLRRPSDPDFAVLRFVPDSDGCYVDIGANQGQSIESIRLFKPRARIHSFEASPGLATQLRRRHRGNATVQIHPYGLGENHQELVLYTPVYKGFVYDGLASVDRESAARWLNPETLYGFRARCLQIRETACRVKRLDDEGLEPIFIKIDVQGHEYQAALGGIETIRRYQPILMIEDLSHRPQLHALLNGLGYKQYLFDAAGFYRADDEAAVNFLLMTGWRAATVVRSET